MGAQPARRGRIDAVELLMMDHDRIEQLFRRFEDLPRGASDDRVSIVRDLTQALSRHASAEEQIFYPAVREALPDGDSLVDESLDEHHEIKELLVAIDDASPSDHTFDDLVHSLIGEVREHIQEEEGDILPRLSRAVGHDRMVEIGERMEKAEAIAPTRPHPHAPDTPPGNLIAGPAAAVVDRLRDAIDDD
jgi:hemerythrin superfamily protein